MAFAHSISFPSPTFTSPFLSRSRQMFNFPSKVRFRKYKIHFVILSHSSRESAPYTEQEALEQFIANSDGISVPCVRTYENDLARLTLVGAVGFEQALTAAAADGGRAATEHIDSGIPSMVVETVFPASTKNATVSTRLFLPARKVKEKAQKLKNSLSEDFITGASYKNILAMTFRQVVMQKLWSFELVLFHPGTQRDMEDLENPRKVLPWFSISSAEERLISVLGEVICTWALQSTERHFVDNFLGKTSSNIFRWFHKSKRIVSKDSSVVIYKLFEDEIIANAELLLESFKSSKASLKGMDLSQKSYWWKPSVHSKLLKIGGLEFSAWTSEFVPAYQLKINANTFKDAKFGGWRKSVENTWEVPLTYSQMAGLADILDIYYEDVYSLPNKQLQCSVVSNYNNISKAKRISSLLKIVSATVASGILLITISIWGQFKLPHLHKGANYPGGSRSPSSSTIECTTVQSADAEKLEAFCTLVIQKIKDAFDWPGDVMVETNLGAWIGEIPKYLKEPHQADSISEGDLSNSADVEKLDDDASSSMVHVEKLDDDASSSMAHLEKLDDGASSSMAHVEKLDDDARSSIQDVACYQVVLSSEGKVIEFQPTNQIGVDHFSANPLANELYSGKILSPSLTEPGQKIQLPKESFVIELLMSVNPDSNFALARPIH